MNNKNIFNINLMTKQKTNDDKTVIFNGNLVLICY